MCLAHFFLCSDVEKFEINFSVYVLFLAADDDVGMPASGGESSGVPFYAPVIVILNLAPLLCLSCLKRWWIKRAQKHQTPGLRSDSKTDDETASSEVQNLCCQPRGRCAEAVMQRSRIQKNVQDESPQRNWQEEGTRSTLSFKNIQCDMYIVTDWKMQKKMFHKFWNISNESAKSDFV